MARFEAESALIIEVPAAEAVVGRHRSELDANAGDPTPFRELTEVVFAAFPEFPPFENQFDEVVPHLTVGHESPIEAMRRAERDIKSSLPVLGRAAAVTLMHELSPEGGWARFASFRLG
jgi:hypothetical protein